MEQNGEVEAAAFVADIAAEQPRYKGINPLYHVPMESPEQDRLEYVGHEKGHGPGSVFQSNPPENQFFADGRYQHGINRKERRHIPKPNAFHHALVGLEPCGTDGGNQHHHIGG